MHSVASGRSGSCFPVPLSVMPAQAGTHVLLGIAPNLPPPPKAPLILLERLVSGSAEVLFDIVNRNNGWSRHLHGAGRRRVAGERALSPAAAGA